MKLIDLLNVIDNRELVLVYNSVNGKMFYDTVKECKFELVAYMNKKVEEIEYSELDDCLIDIRIEY